MDDEILWSSWGYVPDQHPESAELHRLFCQFITTTRVRQSTIAENSGYQQSIGVSMKITNPYGPNTTVLLPGDCNAKCGFCFWNREGAKIPFDATFAAKAIEQLMRLPSEFQVLSVSGGEPLLSPEYTRFCLELLKNRKSLKLQRTVLTTHGQYLSKFLDVTLATFDHINISRHAIGYDANVEVFRTKNIPTDVQLQEVIETIHRRSSVDVTFNCVVPEDVTVSFCSRFILYAKALGANAVSFRKVASSVTPTAAESVFRNKYPVLSETQCTVCRGAVQEDETGFQIRWKGSVEEPSLETKGVYEAVLHPDAKLYTDWNRTIPFPFEVESVVEEKPQIHSVIPPIVEAPQQRTHAPYSKTYEETYPGTYPGAGSGGCGSYGGGCGSR